MAESALQETPCLLCGRALNRDLALPLGNLPPCNRFNDCSGDTHPLSLTECSRCNLVQLLDFPQSEFVRPRHPWIRYNEPSAHLADLAGRLQECTPVTQPTVMGLGPFDNPLLDCMSAWSGPKHMPDLAANFPQEEGLFPYLESFQAALRPEPLATIAAEQGQADIVVCRYLLEHSHDPLASLRGLGLLLKPNGCLLIEVPDSSKFLSAGDYSFIWEEHLCYFTEASMLLMAAQAGYTVNLVLRYPGVLEDALVFILTPGTAPETPSIELGNSRTFMRMRDGLAPLRIRYRETIATAHASGHKLAIFGAGHQAVMFINALNLQDQIDYVIDDAPDKIGQTVPGTSIRIVASSILSENRQPVICLLALSPAAAAKIQDKHAALCEGAVRMYSIFPGGGRSTLIDSIS